MIFDLFLAVFAERDVVAHSVQDHRVDHLMPPRRNDLLEFFHKVGNIYREDRKGNSAFLVHALVCNIFAVVDIDPYSEPERRISPERYGHILSLLRSIAYHLFDPFFLTLPCGKGVLLGTLVDRTVYLGKLLFCHVHFTFGPSVKGRDVPHTFHPFDDRPRMIVANVALSLYEGNGRLSRLHHERKGLKIGGIVRAPVGVFENLVHGFVLFLRTVRCLGTVDSLLNILVEFARILLFCLFYDRDRSLAARLFFIRIEHCFLQTQNLRFSYAFLSFFSL